MQRSFALFLILSVLTACGSTPKREPATVDLEWEFVDLTPFPDGRRACLKEPDVKKLKEKLDRCGCAK